MKGPKIKYVDIGSILGKTDSPCNEKLLAYETKRMDLINKGIDPNVYF